MRICFFWIPRNTRFITSVTRKSIARLSDDVFLLGDFREFIKAFVFTDCRPMKENILPVRCKGQGQIPLMTSQKINTNNVPVRESYMKFAAPAARNRNRFFGEKIAYPIKVIYCFSMH